MNKGNKLLVYILILCCMLLFAATGHTQFKGQRYCPAKFDISQVEWLAERKAEAKEAES